MTMFVYICTVSGQLPPEQLVPDSHTQTTTPPPPPPLGHLHPGQISPCKCDIDYSCILNMQCTCMRPMGHNCQFVCYDSRIIISYAIDVTTVSIGGNHMTRSNNMLRENGCTYIKGTICMKLYT